MLLLGMVRVIVFSTYLQIFKFYLSSIKCSFCDRSMHCTNDEIIIIISKPKVLQSQMVLHTWFNVYVQLMQSINMHGNLAITIDVVKITSLHYL